jgi:hypothetical protein
LWPAPADLEPDPAPQLDLGQHWLKLVLILLLR